MIDEVYKGHMLTKARTWGGNRMKGIRFRSFLPSASNPARSGLCLCFTSIWLFALEEVAMVSQIVGVESSSLVQTLPLLVLSWVWLEAWNINQQFLDHLVVLTHLNLIDLWQSWISKMSSRINLNDNNSKIDGFYYLSLSRNQPMSWYEGPISIIQKGEESYKK